MMRKTPWFVPLGKKAAREQIEKLVDFYSFWFN
jgi:hypothetical protein